MYVNGLAAGRGSPPFKAANVQSSHINTEGKIKSRWKGQAPLSPGQMLGGLDGVRRIADVMMGNQRWESRGGKGKADFFYNGFIELQV